MRKTIGLLIALIMFSSVSFGADDMTLFVHVNKTDEKVVDINKNSNEINENDEILIISQNGIKIKRTGKDKDYAICSSREKTDKSDVDTLCNSIFGTSTSAKAITTNATTGVVGNVVLGVVSLGIAPIFGGINYAVYEDVDKLNKFIENNNLKFCFSNLEEEYKLRKEYALVADMVRIPNYAYNDPLFTQKLNEQIPTLDKALALKIAEQERIAAAKKAEEEVKRAERERMAAVKKAEEEVKRAEVKKELGYFAFENLHETIEGTDEFGNKTKKSVCKIRTNFLINSKEDWHKELMVVYSQIFRIDTSRICNFHYLFENGTQAAITEHAGITTIIPIYQKKGILPAKIDINTNNLQLKNASVKIDRDIYSVASALNNYLKSDSQKTSLSRLKVLYSYFISAGLIQELPLDEQKCRLEAEDIFIAPTVYFARAFKKENTKAHAVKLLILLEKNNAAETTKFLLSIPKVKEFYNYFEK